MIGAPKRLQTWVYTVLVSVPDLIDNLKLLNLTRSHMDSIFPEIHLILVTEADALINSFKVTTLVW